MAETKKLDFREEAAKDATVYLNKVSAQPNADIENSWRKTEARC